MVSTHGWMVTNHVHTVGDVNADAKANLLGFGYAGVYVATAK